jgi:hypothetical protein
MPILANFRAKKGKLLSDTWPESISSPWEMIAAGIADTPKAGKNHRNTLFRAVGQAVMH